MIEMSKLDTQQFSLSDGNASGEAFVDIKFNNSPLYFRIYSTPDSFHQFYASKVPYSPSFNQLELRNDIEGSSFEIDVLITFFNTWLNYDVKVYIEDHEVEDLWQQNAIEELLDIEDIQFDTKEVFKDHEKTRLKFYLEDLKASILNEHKLTNEKVEKVNERFDELEKSSHKLTKKDWKIYALGILTSIAMTVEVPSIEELIQPFTAQVQAIKTINQPKLEKTPENFI